MKDFYMTLFSNSSMSYHHGNRTSSFTVQLPRSFDLAGDWEVALSEIQYPYTFFSVQNGQNELKIKSFTTTQEFLDSKGKTQPLAEWSTIKITPGFYVDIKDIIRAINSAIEKQTKLGNFFQFDNLSQRISIKKGNTVKVNEKVIVAFKASDRLALQLGYRPNEEVEVSTSHAPNVASITSGIPDMMLIYCDILEPQITGDSWSKVLRTLNLSPDGVVPFFSKCCTSNFAQLQYIPLQQKHFESISIDIRDGTGELLPFRFGTLSVKLHFRRNILNF